MRRQQRQRDLNALGTGFQRGHQHQIKGTTEASVASPINRYTSVFLLAFMCSSSADFQALADRHLNQGDHQRDGEQHHGDGGGVTFSCR